MTYTKENIIFLDTLVSPLARQLMEMDKKTGLYLVLYQGDKSLKFDELEPIYQLTIGKTEKYEKLAKAKAKPAWRTGHSSRDAAENAGFSGVSGDCIWPGSSVITVGDNRIVASVSGLTGIHDEYLSWMILATLEMVGKDVIDRLSKEGGIMP